MIWGKLGAFVAGVSFGVVSVGVVSVGVSSVSIRIRFTEGDVVVVVLGASVVLLVLFWSFLSLLSLLSFLSLLSLLSVAGSSSSLCGRFITGVVEVGVGEDDDDVEVGEDGGVSESESRVVVIHRL